MFYLMDHVFQETIPFEGNFTFQVVGGGVGYQENIKYFTQEEIALYNYIPGKTYVNIADFDLFFLISE